MTEFLDGAHAVLRWVHIVLGFAGLALFWGVVLLPKGTKRHRRMGQCFVWTAWLVGGSGVFSSFWALAHLSSFASFLGQLSPERRAEMATQMYFLFTILLFLSAATVAGSTYGALIMRYRNEPERLRRTVLPMLQILTLGSAAWLIAFGGYHLFLATGEDSNFPRSAYNIPLILGAIGLVTGWSEFRQIYRPLSGPREWLYQHIGQMFGTGIAFHTAFLVFGANRLFGLRLPPAFQFLPWLLPSVVGGIWTYCFIRKLKIQNGDLHPNAHGHQTPNAV